jgi:hypothetical protein
MGRVTVASKIQQFLKKRRPDVYIQLGGYATNFEWGPVRVDVVSRDPLPGTGLTPYRNDSPIEDDDSFVDYGYTWIMARHRGAGNDPRYASSWTTIGYGDTFAEFILEYLNAFPPQ